MIYAIRDTILAGMDAWTTYKTGMIDAEWWAWGGTAAVAFCVASIWSWWTEEEVKIKDKTAEFGNARWATDSEVEDMGILHDGASNIIVGGYGGHYVGIKGHGLLCAPTGAGKGVSVIVPSLLMYRGSVVVSDPKGENLAISARCREMMGQDIVNFDPWEVGMELCGRPTSRHNPLAYIDVNNKDAVTRVLQLVEAIGGGSPGGTGDYFHGRALQLLELSILYVLIKFQGTPDCTLVTARRLLMAPPTEMRTWMQEAVTYTDYLRGEVVTTANDFLGTAFRGGDGDEMQLDESFSSVRQTLGLILGFLSDLSMQDFFSGDDCDLREIADNPTSVYIVVEPSKAKIAKVFQRVIYTSIFQCLFEKKRNLDKPIVFVMDEFSQLGKFDIINDTLTIVRSYGIKLLLVIQSMAQLRAAYREDAEKIIGNTTEISFAPQSHEECKRISERIGKKTIDAKSISGGKTTISKMARDFLTPQEVATTDGVFIFPPKCRPILAKQLRYYKDSRFKGKYDKHYK